MQYRFTSVRLLVSNDVAWKAKRHLIAKARQTLDLSYFILEVDASTSRLMLDLIEAAERGVQVRLMVDYFTTFQQAPALRTLGAIANLQVRRYGLPTPVWLAALEAAGIDPDGFVKALMSANGPQVAAALKGSSLFGPAVTDHVGALPAQAGHGSAVDFPLQVMAALQAAPDAAPAGAPLDVPSSDSSTRAAGLQKVALVIQILRGLKQFLHRNHHKLLLADGAWFVMGGRNLADAYHCDRPAAGHAFQDTDVLAHDGHAGGSPHAKAFEVLWNSAHAADITRSDPLDSRPALPLSHLEKAADALAGQRPGATFRSGLKLPDMDGVLVDNLPSDKGDPSITQAYVEQIQRLVAGGGAAAIDIVSAYLFPMEGAADSAALFALRNALAVAAAAGVAVNIYTNSMASTDLKPINKAAYPTLVALLEAGVRVFELGPGQGSLHTKAAAIGDACLIVGSYNMDPRSELYDTNNIILLHDASGAATAAFRRTRISKLKWMSLTVEVARRLAGENPAAPSARMTRGLL